MKAERAEDGGDPQNVEIKNGLENDAFTVRDARDEEVHGKLGVVKIIGRAVMWPFTLMFAILCLAIYLPLYVVELALDAGEQIILVTGSGGCGYAACWLQLTTSNGRTASIGSDVGRSQSGPRE